MVNRTDLIAKYFPDLDKERLELFATLEEQYLIHNKNVNVISRKDMDNLMCHHILHSLAIAKHVQFKKGAMILDIGTGGGLPGIPLAILFPESRFVLIDGTAKKIMVANSIIETLGLKNCVALHQRAEYFTQKFDFVVARAVTRLEKLLPLTLPLIEKNSTHSLPNGLLTLKGGDLSDEIKEVSKNNYIECHPLSAHFEESFFETKQLVYVQK